MEVQRITLKFISVDWLQPIITGFLRKSGDGVMISSVLKLTVT